MIPIQLTHDFRTTLLQRRFNVLKSFQLGSVLLRKRRYSTISGATICKTYKLLFVDFNMIAAQTEGSINGFTHHLLNNFIGAFDKMLKRKGDNVSQTFIRTFKLSDLANYQYPDFEAFFIRNLCCGV